MLLTIFSASNYGGVCRNRGGVLIFDEKGPAEVKEFYEPPLDQYREMCEQKVVEGVLPRMKRWRSLSKLPGGSARRLRLEEREKQRQAEGKWTHLLFDVDTSDGSAHLKPTDIEALKARTQAARERANSRRTESGSSGKLAAVERRASRSTTPKGPKKTLSHKNMQASKTPPPALSAAHPCRRPCTSPSLSHPSPLLPFAAALPPLRAAPLDQVTWLRHVRRVRGRPRRPDHRTDGLLRGDQPERRGARRRFTPPSPPIHTSISHLHSHPPSPPR